MLYLYILEKVLTILCTYTRPHNQGPTLAGSLVCFGACLVCREKEIVGELSESVTFYTFCVCLIVLAYHVFNSYSYYDSPR